jgi:hypothetical protein
MRAGGDLDLRVMRWGCGRGAQCTGTGYTEFMGTNATRRLVEAGPKVNKKGSECAHDRVQGERGRDRTKVTPTVVTGKAFQTARRPN